MKLPLPLVAAAVLGAALLAPPAAVPDARADDPAPVFTAPLAVTHALHPFVPGTVKVFSGREEGHGVTVVETHLRETRAFVWSGGTTECRIVEEVKFVRGAGVERQRVFLAQADGGAVWTFGEVDDSANETGQDAQEPGGWIVGERGPDDPLDSVSVAAPSVFLPAAPQPGDTWMPADAAPGPVKTDRALAGGTTVRAAGARYTGCLRVAETDSQDEKPVVSWFAPGAGLVQIRGPEERLLLRASTLPRAR